MMEQINFENYNKINEVEILYNTLAYDLNLTYDSAYPIVRSRKKKVLDISKPYINFELKSQISFLV